MTSFYKLLNIAQDHLARYKVMAFGDMYWAGRRDEAGYWRDMIGNCLTRNEIELPQSRLDILNYD